MPELSDIRGIIFDLDGTLYESAAFAATIQDAAALYIAGIKGIESSEARRQIVETRSRLTDERDEAPTLSAVCGELGGTISALHAFFETCLQPEAYLTKDQRVVSLLNLLHKHFQLYLYTNNNRLLTARILAQLGLGEYFRRIHTIDDTWIAKPDCYMLNRILAEAGLQPQQALFVGDRYDVDLRLPELSGCPVYQSQSVEQLLRLKDLLKV